MTQTSQFKPLPEAEKNICRRISAIRRFEGLGLGKFATAIGASHGQLSNIGALRVPVKAGLALAICKTFKVNPEWLATGDGMPIFKGLLAGPCSHPKMLFSEYYQRYLSRQFQDRSVDINEAMTQLRRTIEVTERSLKAHPHKETQTQLEFLKRVFTENKQAIAEKFYIGALASDHTAVKTRLTEAATTDRTADMKSPLANLRARLNERTSEPGKKSELAKFLGAPLASVSRWLSGDREPGGEITLKMLHWVELQERK